MDANQVQRKKTVRADSLRRRACAARRGRGGRERSAALNARRRPLRRLLTRRHAQDMVNQLNKLVAQKKKRTEELQTKADLLAKGGGAAAKGKGKKGAKGGGGDEEGGEGGGDADGGNGDITAQMTTQQLMGRGRRDMTETDKSIARSARVVEDTIAIGQQTAAMLAEQTHQMEKIMNDLDEITFSMKKAQKLLRDITRSMATDKCILMFLMLIVGGIVTIVVLKVAKVNFVKGINISVPLPTKSPPPPMPPPPSPASGRRMLRAPAPAGWGAGGEAWRAWDGAALGAAGGWPLQ